MQTPAATCTRLLVALEDLAAQEEGAITAGDADALAALQRRATPVVAYLCEHTTDVSEWGRHRIAALVARRERSLARLSGQIEGARGRLENVTSNQRRVAALAPMYGRQSPRKIRLSAVG